VRTLLGLCRSAGSPQIIVVDLSRAELDVPVVKVLVPGRASRVDWLA
jgi:ribosomal protein S12 methylthiotransferase accessory factor YcaO